MKFRTVLTLCAGSILTVVACQDKSYDLKDIDMTVTVGGDISLPVGDVEPLTLGQFIGLEDPGIPVSVDENGDFHIDFKGSAASEEYEFGSKEIDLPLNHKISGEVINYPAVSSRALVPSGSGNSFTIKKDLDFKYKGNQMSEIIKDVKSFSMNNSLYIATSVIKNGVKSAKVRIKSGSTITFPAYVLLSVQTNTNYEVRNGNVLFMKNDLLLDDGSGFEIKMLGMDLTKVPSGQGFINHCFTFSDKISFDLSYSIEDVELNSPSASAQISLEMSANKAEVTEIVAKANIDPEVDEFEVDLSKLTEVLGEGSVLDLKDLSVTIFIENETPLAGEITGEIKCFKDGKQVSEIVAGKDKPISIKAYGKSEFTIEGLKELLRIIPDKLWVGNYSIKPESEWFSFDPRKTNKVAIDFAFDAPAAFGKDLAIELSQTIDLNLALGGEAQINGLGLEFDVENTTPLNFLLDAVPVDKDGNLIENVTAECKADIKAGSLDKPQTSKASINFAFRDSDIGIDAIIIKLKASSDPEHEGIALNENQGIILKNIVASIRDGITFDLNYHEKIDN